MAPLTLVIANRNHSSWSLRPWLVMKVAGIPFTEQTILLDRPETKEEIAKASPSGWIPCLQVGDRRIWDSLAICEYLSETFPDRQLWPRDQWARAIARAVTAEMHSGFRSLPNGLRMNMTSQLPTPELTGKLGQDVARLLQIWRDCRGEFGAEGPFLFGQFCIADAFFAPVITRFVTYQVPVGKMERTYMDAIMSLDAMGEWKAAAEVEMAHQRSEGSGR